MDGVARDEVLAALGQPGAFMLLDETVLGVEPRDEHVLVLVDVPRLGGPVAVEVSWPDDELTGTMTGEPCSDLRGWVVEVATWLDEEFGTADAKYVRRRRDPITGRTIVEFGP